MSHDTGFDDLMDRVQRGDQAAAAEVYQRFASCLIGLARTRLSQVVRQKVDPEDGLQSVFKSFFLRHAQGAFELAGWDGLWSLLTVITLRKCGHQVEYLRAARRDPSREVALGGGNDSSGSFDQWQAIAREPTPQEAASLAETVQELFDGLDARQRSIVEFTLQGYSAVEISTEVGVSVRTVYRVIGHLKRRLEQNVD